MSTAKRKAPREEQDTLSATPKKKTVRHRAALACEECRSRKRRCDGATPACGGCVKRMSACVYASEIQAKAWREGMIQSLRSRLEELEKEGESLLGSDREISRLDTSIPTSTRHPSPGVEVTVDAGVAEDTRPARRPEVTFATPAPSISKDQRGADTARPQRNVGSDAEATSPHDYHARGLEPCSVERLMKPIDQAIDSRSGPNSAPGNPTWATNLVAQVTSRIGTGCSCSTLLGTSRWSFPLRRKADDLIALYFARVHRMYPILHERTFRKQYGCLWQSTSDRSCSGLCKQKSQGKTFSAMVHAVLALASLFETGTPEQNTHRADDYFRRAQDIDLLEILDYEVGIELVQLGLLMGFYLQSTERFSKCWNITGLTIRMAQNMGLQLSLGEARRKGLFAPHSAQLDCEMRIRVWYGCVLLDREISMSFGRPLMIVTGGEAVRLPEAIDDNRLSEEPGNWNAQPAGLPSLLESYIQTIKLYDILKQVLDREELKESSDITPDIRSLLSLDTLIMEWRDALPPYLQYDPSSSEGTSSASHAGNGSATPPAGFSAQAKRLYARFLHVRVLILRPALDLLFQKQQHIPPRANKHSMEARVQDLMLSDIATQCAFSAHSLVKLLNTQIQNHSLVAWWYNISYLHTCGSTLLMARLCSFKDAGMSGEFSSSWELCLQCISRYTGVSSIAKKSVRLLQESAKCLLPDSSTQKQQPPFIPRSQGPTIQESFTVNREPPLNDTGENVLDHDWHFAPPEQLPVDLIQEQPIEVPPLDAPESDPWTQDACASSYWPFMPFLSQLETLPANFDPSSLERQTFV